MVDLQPGGTINEFPAELKWKGRASESCISCVTCRVYGRSLCITARPGLPLYIRRLWRSQRSQCIPAHVNYSSLWGSLTLGSVAGCGRASHGGENKHTPQRLVEEQTFAAVLSLVSISDSDAVYLDSSEAFVKEERRTRAVLVWLCVMLLITILQLYNAQLSLIGAAVIACCHLKTFF